MRDVIFESCNIFILKRTMENLDHACQPMKFSLVKSVGQLVDKVIELTVAQLVDKVNAPNQSTARSNKKGGLPKDPKRQRTAQLDLLHNWLMMFNHRPVQTKKEIVSKIPSAKEPLLLANLRTPAIKINKK